MNQFVDFLLTVALCFIGALVFIGLLYLAYRILVSMVLGLTTRMELGKLSVRNAMAMEASSERKKLQERIEFLEAQHRAYLQEKIERAYNARPRVVVDAPTIAQHITRADRR